MRNPARQRGKFGPTKEMVMEIPIKLPTLPYAYDAFEPEFRTRARAHGRRALVAGINPRIASCQLTEAGVMSNRGRESDNGSETGYASPPCFMHELDPSYLGYLSKGDLLALLNELLEGERAGARGVWAMSEQATSEQARMTLREIGRDESRFCAMLLRHIERLGGTPSGLTGPFHKKLAAIEAMDERLGLLNRGQGWVARRLREAMPRISDELVRADLQLMLEVHLHNIERCTQLKSRTDAQYRHSF